MKVIRTEIEIGGQSIIFKETFEYNSHKLEVKIKSDAYKSQSYARVFIWSKEQLQWNKLTDLHYSNMKTKEGLSYCQGKRTINDFKEDVDQLLNQAKEILN